MECKTTPIDGSGRPSQRVHTASMGDKMTFKLQEDPGARLYLGLLSASAPGIHATDSVCVASFAISTSPPWDSDAGPSSMIRECRERMLNWALPGSTGCAISFSSPAPFRTRRCSKPSAVPCPAIECMTCPWSPSNARCTSEALHQGRKRRPTSTTPKAKANPGSHSTDFSLSELPARPWPCLWLVMTRGQSLEGGLGQLGRLAVQFAVMDKAGHPRPSFRALVVASASPQTVRRLLP